MSISNVGSYVIVEIADYDNKKMIVWTYKDWEVDHLKKTSIVDRMMKMMIHLVLPSKIMKTKKKSKLDPKVNLKISMKN